MSQQMQQAPSREERFLLTSQEREVFGKRLLESPAEKTFLEGQGRRALLEHIRRAVQAICNEPGPNTTRVDHFMVYFETETTLWSCFDSIIEAGALGDNWTLEKVGEELDELEVLYILFGMCSDNMALQIKTHVTKWVAETVPQLVPNVDDDVVDNVEIMPPEATWEGFDDTIEGWVDGVVGSGSTDYFRCTLEEYTREQGGFTIHYKTPKQRNHRQHWTCLGTLTTPEGNKIRVVGNSSTKDGSREAAAKEMLRRLADTWRGDRLLGGRSPIIFAETFLVFVRYPNDSLSDRSRTYLCDLVPTSIA
ncbi:hypothetical protein TWF730_001815 [Orbilia blumenaviensis]|uniref:DRBM domain-containing protein n=1 Tax=Orbilia blumenaviensis TaxID=1796055 RepID=A0AAV9UC37_9PEZI